MTHFPHGKQPPALISFFPPTRVKIKCVLKVKTTFSFTSWVLLQIFCLKYLNSWCRKPFKFFLNRDQFRESLIICLPHRKWKMQTTKVKCDFSEGKQKLILLPLLWLFCSLPPLSCWEKTGNVFILSTATGKMRREIWATGQRLLNKAEVAIAKSSALQTKSCKKDSLLGWLS